MTSAPLRTRNKLQLTESNGGFSEEEKFGEITSRCSAASWLSGWLLLLLLLLLIIIIWQDPAVQKSLGKQ